MNKYLCSLINFKFAIFDNVIDSFVGQKVIVKYFDSEIVGCVESCSTTSTKVNLFGDVSGFVFKDIVGIFVDSFIKISLSPSILGRKLDFFGNPIDTLPPIISIAKSPTFYRKSKTNFVNHDEIVGENDWLIKSEDFQIQKGQVKSTESIEQLIPLLEISNLALIVVELDYHSKKINKIQNLLQQNQLDQVTVLFQSQSQNDVAISTVTISQAANYLSDQLGFDVLILVFNSQLLEQIQSNDFYFAQKLDHIASFGAGSSISIINL